MIFKRFFLSFKESILKLDGNKYNPKGYIKSKRKLYKISSNRIICVFLYTAQKALIKYQKNTIIIKLIIK